MVQFDPTKMLGWMWQMRWWGRWLVASTFLVTVIAIITWILSYYNAQFAVFAVVMWAILYFSYVIAISKFKKKLDDLISKGEHLQAVVVDFPVTSLKLYDAQSAKDKEQIGSKVDAWDASIAKALKDTQYERLWMSNAGLTKPEDETKVQGFEWYFMVWRNWMVLRLKRLKEIRDSL